MAESSIQRVEDHVSRRGRGRRRSPRLDLPSRPAVWVSTVRCGYSGVLLNLSRGGAFIETDKIHFIGERLRLKFSLPLLGAFVEITGVVRHPYASRGAGEGVGVQFAEVPEALSALLQKCIDALRAR